MTIMSPQTASVFTRLAAIFVFTAALAVGGCSDEPATDTTPPEVTTPDAPETSVDPATAEAAADEPEKRRKTSILGAPIQKAEDVRDAIGGQQQDLLDQIDKLNGK